MAQTKRKRQTKHRGNAAGSVTNRGRTGRRPDPKDQKKRSREELRVARLSRRPTWTSMAQRAALASGLMFIVLLLLTKGRSLLYPLVFALVAFCLYVPLGYFLETFLWRRRMARQNRPSG